MKTAEEFKIRLEYLTACDEAIEWAKNKTAKEAWDQCERGDWLLWWAKKENTDLRKLTLAKARCAKTVIHLMKDQRSIDAVEAAEKYGLGHLSLDDLRGAAAAAYAAADAAATYAATAAYAAAAADAAASAAYATAATYAAAAYAAYAADAAASAADAARAETLKKCAEIVRDNITPEFL